LRSAKFPPPIDAPKKTAVDFFAARQKSSVLPPFFSLMENRVEIGREIFDF